MFKGIFGGGKGNKGENHSLPSLSELQIPPKMENDQAIEIRGENPRREVEAAFGQGKRVILDVNIYDVQHFWFEVGDISGYDSIYGAVYDAGGQYAGADLYIHKCDSILEVEG